MLGDRYELLEVLGKGAHASVWRARDHRLGREVAIKLLHEGYSIDPQARERFNREGAALAALNHPNVVTVFDREVDSEPPFIVMELLSEANLRTVMDSSESRPTDFALVSWGAQIAGGLQAAHEHGYLHRDIKPANIGFSAQGLPKIVDLGISRLASDARLTTTNTSVFTLSYASPEQLLGRTLEPSTDVWSLGCLLYEGLTRRLPFPDLSPVGLASRAKEPAPALRSLRPDLPESLEDLLGRMLSVDPSERPTAQEAQKALSDAATSLLASKAEDTVVVPTPGSAAGDSDRAVTRRVETPETAKYPAGAATTLPLPGAQGGIPQPAAAEGAAAPAEDELPAIAPLPSHLAPTQSTEVPRTSEFSVEVSPAAKHPVHESGVETWSGLIMSADAE